MLMFLKFHLRNYLLKKKKKFQIYIIKDNILNKHLIIKNNLKKYKEYPIFSIDNAILQTSIFSEINISFNLEVIFLKAFDNFLFNLICFNSWSGPSNYYVICSDNPRDYIKTKL